jgi:hyperosmotically inducible protein
MSILRKLFLVLCCGMMIVSLGACKKEGPAERTGKKLDEAAEKTGDKIKETAEKAGDKIEDAGKKVKDATKK